MMTKFRLYRFLLFVSTFLLLSYFVEKTCGFLIKQNHDFKPSYVASGTIDADILVHGPSRAVYHVVPNIIEDSTDLKTYNIALNASAINEQLLIFKLYLNHNKAPKVIALEMHRGYLREAANLYLHSSNYVPFLNEENILMQVKEQDYFLYQLNYFPGLKYFYHSNNLLNEIAKGALQYWKGSKEVNFTKGFQAKNKEWITGLPTYKYFPERIEHSEKLLNGYKDFIELAQKNDVEVIFFTAPLYQAPAYENTIIHDLAEEYDIPYWEYNYMPLNQDTTFFYDATHLNKKGATLFSMDFASDMKEYLEKRASNTANNFLKEKN